MCGGKIFVREVAVITLLIAGFVNFNMMFMIRILFVFSLLLVYCGVSGQNPAIKKSADIVVLKGKSYYLHTVEAGQTFFSICKAYGVDVNVVKELNDKKDNSLSLYDVLKIPYTEPFVQKDGKYYYHKVTKGETLYSIARGFDIKVKRILKFNEAYSESVPLAIGAVVRLPLNEISIPAANVAVAQSVVPERPVPAEKVVPAARQENKQPEQVRPAEAVAVPKETVAERAGKEIPAYISEVVMPSEPFVKVALLLPFFAKEYASVTDTLNVRSVKSISPKSEQFVSFYEGILLAADSMKHQGYKVDLHVYDTERDVEKMRTITEELNVLKPDLIIGPVYGSVFKVMADNLNHKEVPMVYPLSSRSENFGKYPNFVQVNASAGVLAERVSDWLARQSADANIISINLSKNKPEEQTVGELAEKKIFTGKINQTKGVHFFKWNFEEEPLAAIRHLLLPDRENIIVLPTTKEADVSKILPELSAYADSYKITVVGQPEWQTFTSVDHETYYKLNVKIFTYSYVDNFSAQAKAFAKKYHEYFSGEPGNLAYKSYDLGLYFIGLAARYRDRSLEALEYCQHDGAFSRFNFSKIQDEAGKENKGLFIVNYGSDYQLKVVPLD